MKKLISLILAVIMVFSVSSIFAFAADETYYEVTFADLPYDVAPYRSDYVASYMGYEYGTDYWFTVTNNEDGYIVTSNNVKHPVAAGTKTEFKGSPIRIGVKEGSTLEFTVETAEYVNGQTARVIAFPTGTATEDLAELDLFSPDLTINPGEPYEQFYLAKSKYDTYGIKPDQNLTICISEYHLYNHAFLYEFTPSDFYTANRLFFCGEDATDLENKDNYIPVDWNNTKVIYENETFFFEVRMDLNSEYDLHYDTYQVYYMNDDLGSLVGTIAGTEKVYLDRVYRYHDYDEETGLEEQVDIYAIENVSPDVVIKVEDTVTYTFDMLGQLISSGDINLDNIDLSPMLDFVVRIAKLVVKMLNAFGLNISVGDLLG